MRRTPNRCASNGALFTTRAASSVDVAGAVVIVAVLGLWLIPATGGVVRSSKNSRCLNHLMQIGYANAVYAAQDAADMALPVHHKQFEQCPGHSEGGFCFTPQYIGAYEWGGKSGVGRATWVTGAPGNLLGSKYGTTAGFGPASRPLNGILYPDPFADALADGGVDRAQTLADTQLDLDVYRCPSDTGYTGIHCPDFEQRGLSSFDHFGTSYNANIFMTGPGGGGEMQSNSPYLHRMSEMLNPSRTIAYQENNGRFAWTAAPESDSCLFIGGGIPGTVGGWHGKDWTFNAVFLDGHSDVIYMRGYRNERSLASGQFRCITIRGEGWQIDTLPVPRVRTRVAHSGGYRPSYEDCLSPGN